MYVRSDIAFNTREDLDVEGQEGVWTDILLPKSKPILIGCIYRPPDQSDFVEHLEHVLLLCISQETCILGDTNFNLLIPPSNPKTKKYLHTL